ncbi:RNA-binding protein [Desulfovibrio subterraneus]|uniref:RNA-binding protein n=1 Tax=Desulfovibrio subterraneus TaxID=2718620 RepID=A0A7J0BHJ3_9BACT|nr:RNA-binding protein [Desulfovibrio subterraneus]WBF66954.1 RNA-binding protein [Desulfovibrio subterraneus]GFM32681.1 RNA-binding protein [Desulfovibrio subterraneus]
MNKFIYVGNLSWECTNNDLHALFYRYGAVVSARVVKDSENGYSRGFGLVEMGISGSADAIKSLDGSSYQGRNIKVNESQPRGGRLRF